MTNQGTTPTVKQYEAANNATTGFVGIEERDGEYTAITTTRSKTHKTFKGALRFFEGTAHEGKIPTAPTWRA